MRRTEIDWLFADKNAGADANAGDHNNRCSRLFPEAWKNFANAVRDVGDDDDDDDAVGTTTPQHHPEEQRGDPRAVLHAYYDRLLGDDPAVRLAACRSWMQWEMTVFSSSSSTNNATRCAQAEFYSKAYAPVAVWDPTTAGAWSYRDGNDNLLDGTATIDKLGLPRDCATAVEALRVGLCDDAIPLAQQQRQPASVRPVRPLHNDNNNTTSSTDKNSNNSTTSSSTVPPEYASFVPAQSMLTCFYSVNNRYALNELDLLTSAIPRIRHIPCIAVHGGLDRVCPPDTALHVLRQYNSNNNNNNMELRIPLQSGHSMYDVAIANELVRATECMAKQLLKEQQQQQQHQDG